MFVYIPLPKEILSYITSFQTMDDGAFCIYYPETYIREYYAKKEDTDEYMYIFKNLKKLFLTNNKYITNDGLKHMYHLEELTCGVNNNLTDIILIHLKNTLKILRVANNTSFTDNGIRDSSLIELHCGINMHFSDNGIKNLKLKRLSCGFNSSFTNDGIRYSNLEYLSCGFNENFTNDVIHLLPLKKLKCGWNFNIWIKK